MSSSFVGYLLMTFLTAVNDSLFRWMISPIARHLFKDQVWNIAGYRMPPAELVLPLGLFVFVLPFVVFAPWAGAGA